MKIAFSFLGLIIVLALLIEEDECAPCGIMKVGKHWRKQPRRNIPVAIQKRYPSQQPPKVLENLEKGNSPQKAATPSIIAMKKYLDRKHSQKVPVIQKLNSPLEAAILKPNIIPETSDEFSKWLSLGSDEDNEELPSLIETTKRRVKIENGVVRTGSQEIVFEGVIYETLSPFPNFERKYYKKDMSINDFKVPPKFIIQSANAEEFSLVE